MNLKYCRNCGYQVRAKTIFCHNCGFKLFVYDEKSGGKTISAKMSSPKEKSRKHFNYKKSIKILAPIALGLIILFYSHILNATTYISAEYFGNNNIVDLANRSGFSYVGKVEFYKSNPTLVTADKLNEVCPNEDPNTVEYGCYRTDLDRIYVLDSQYPELDDVESWTAAHELMHKIYSHNPPSKQFLDDIQKTLNSSDAQSIKDIRESMSKYPNNEALLRNELHSFFSAVPSYDVDATTDEYYSRYFSVRNKPFLAKYAFDSKIKNRASALELERVTLETKSKQIDDYKIEWLDKIEAYLPINTYYGDVATYNKNVDAYNNNLEIYKQKVDEYERSRLSFNQKIEDYNKMLLSFLPSGASLPLL